MDFVGVVELDAIEGDEEALEGTVLGEGVEAGGEERVASAGQPSSRLRMQLSVGMRSMPNRDWQLERASSSCMRRWKARKEGSCRKKGASAQEAASVRE